MNPEVQEHGQDHDEGMDAPDRPAGVDGPGPRQSGRRHEEEPEQGPEEAVEGPPDVVGEDHEQDDDRPGARSGREGRLGTARAVP